MLRRDDEPVDPGSRTPRNTQALPERDPLIGTSVADFIKASGHERRTDRPDTWLQPDRSPSLFACTAGAVHTWVLDTTFDEDRARNRKDNGPENLAVLRRLALNVLRTARPAISIKRKRKRAGWSDAFARSILAQMR